jgi:hypothetical protein
MDQYLLNYLVGSGLVIESDKQLMNMEILDLPVWKYSMGYTFQKIMQNL